ncbi:cytochrome P450 2J4-like [Physella acuta]|uniref:cytochrome P450 2J4-like n=1 Tax=Physella acuta TaxID=109671 RepID=UPI0027DD5D94|nr:cytochrome P450 2J4-like [Physella acuta]XP_059161816.1 cytochrome P450 2J4-like [Physella acuta]
MDLATIAIATILILLFYLWFRRHDPRLPPCPVRPLPVVGHLLSLDKDPREQYKRWRQQCGDIFSLYLGGRHAVVLNGYSLIYKTLVKQGDDFSARPPDFFDEEYGIGLGLILIDGQLWKEQRGKTIQILKKLGMGKNVLAERIQEEAEFYIKALTDLKGKPTDIRELTDTTVSNVISHVVFGHRFEYNEPLFVDAIQALKEIMNNSHATSVLHFFPFVRYLPFDLTKSKETKSFVDRVLNFVEREIENIQQGRVKKENFISEYLNKRNDTLEKCNKTILDKDHPSKIVIELFFAGSETTTETLIWCVLYVLNYPEVQEKIYREIVENVGTDRMPNILDRTKLPYLGAVIMETLRLSSIVPYALPHSCYRDVEVNGYTIPKGTVIIPNLTSISHDEKIWGEDVMSFRPERFLDVNGKLKNPEEFVPFSLGRRVCLGESLANMELFIFLSSMFQRFEVKPEDPGCLPSMEFITGISTKSLPFKVRLIQRECSN